MPFLLKTPKCTNQHFCHLQTHFCLLTIHYYDIKFYLVLFSFSFPIWSWHVQLSNSIPSIWSKWIQLSSLLELIGDSAAGEPHWPGVWIVCVRDSLPHPPPPSPFPSLVQEGWTLEETPTGAPNPPPKHTHTHWLPNLSCLWLQTMLQTAFVYYSSLFSLFFCLFIFFPTAWIHFNSFLRGT